MQAHARPYLNCLGGVKIPTDNATIQALLANACPSSVRRRPHESHSTSVNASQPKKEKVRNAREMREVQRVRRVRERSERERRREREARRRHPSESRLADPAAWREWIFNRHERLAAASHVSSTYMSASEDVEEPGNEAAAAAAAEGGGEGEGEEEEDEGEEEAAADVDGVGREERERLARKHALRSLRKRQLRAAQVSSRMLTYAHVCSRMLTYTQVCSRMLTHAQVCGSCEQRRCPDVC